MSADAFLDTNIFVYAVDGADARKQAIADRLVREALATGSACTSYQVVQEFLNTVLSKARVAMASEQARGFLDVVLLPLMQVAPSADLYHRALDVRGRYGFGLYDSLIVAAAQGAGCARLYTEDLQHGQAIEGLRIVDPFRAQG